MTVLQSGIAPVSPDKVSEAVTVTSSEPAGLVEPLAEGVAPVPVSEISPSHGAHGATPGATPAGTAEPILIEVWRLHRQHREPRHARQARERPGAGERRDGREGRPPSHRHADRYARPERTRGEPSRQEQRPEKQAEGAPQGARPPRERSRHPEGRRGPPRDQRGAQGRHDKGHEPRRQEERRDKPPDPNSPFAKLLALKAQLERRDGDKP
jgi:ATP-dependent RNA helicase SUPV3L1/SUV3